VMIVCVMEKVEDFAIAKCEPKELAPSRLVVETLAISTWMEFCISCY
jgi:hypothetical protein